MHISVIGAGAVGGALAALLDRAGHEVSVVARGETLAAIRERGVRLSGAAGTHTARLHAAETVAATADAVLLAVKTFQAEQALREQARHIGARDVVVLQNGVRGPAHTAQLLSRARGVFGLLTTFPASGLGGGAIKLTGGGLMQLGALSPPDTGRAATLAAVFRDALPTRAAANLPGLLWMKLLLNQVNALPAITGTSVQHCCAHPRLAPLLAAALSETVTVVDALGVRLEAVGRLHPTHTALVRAGCAETVVRASLGRMFGVFPNPASTLQSIRRGEATEIDALNGEVVRTGAQLGIEAPANALLTRLVHRVREHGTFLPVTEVMRQWRNSSQHSS